MRALRNATLRQLQIFEAAAEQLSYARAAERLHLTQPAVSMQMARLEDSVGLPLFERIGKKLYLTTAGSQLLVHIRRISQALREAGESMDAIRGLATGQLSIAVVSTAKYFAPTLLTKFRALHPNIELNLSDANREVVLQLLRGNAVDLAIMGRPPDDMETSAESFAPHPHVVIAPPGHPLCRRRRLGVKELAGEPFISREAGSGTRSAMERFFSHHKIAPAVAIVMASNESIKQAVMAGMGLSFISSHTIGLELQTGHLVALDVTGLPVMRRWYVVHLAAKRLTPTAEAFKRFVFSEAPGYLATMFPIRSEGSRAGPRNAAALSRKSRRGRGSE
jgi:DNA-binding transcriptional LysR family regulator